MSRMMGEFDRAVVLGGAGFIGSHLCDALLDAGTAVVCIDNLCTGRHANIAHLFGAPGFALIQHDVTDPLPDVGELDVVFHLASAASPDAYHRLPIETLRAGSLGTEHGLQLAERYGARFVLASTSECYGDPDRHPQTEDYVGHVNPIGPRSVYDEAKRFAEAMTFAYARPGNPVELTVNEIASVVAEIIGSQAGIQYLPAVVDDPQRRCPDITTAIERLDWRPLVQLDEGLKQTIAWFVEQSG